MSDKNAIGIIANPASGKDIRRMVAYGISNDNTDKVKIVQQIILSASITGLETIYYMPEYYGIVQSALKEIYYNHRVFLNTVKIQPTHTEILGTESDTVRAAEKMREEGVSCIITLGGDGTNRVVAKHCGQVPLIPISTGTNNVFPKSIQGTTAGLAAGIYAAGKFERDDSFILRTKRLEIWEHGKMTDMALIDAVVVDDVKTAARAMWETEHFRQIFLSSCRLNSIGISAIGAPLVEISERDSKGMYIEAEPDVESHVHFPIVPGLFASVGISSWRTIGMNDFIEVGTVPCVIALDGEKDLFVKQGSSLKIKLTWNGPRIVNIHQVLREACRINLFFNNRADFDCAALRE